MADQQQQKQQPQPLAPVNVTAEQVLAYNAPTPNFLCSLGHNVYGIEFLKFTIRDMETQAIVFDVEREREGMPPLDQITPEMEVAARSIRYRFKPDFLNFKTIGAKLVFAVGQHAVPNFRMVERHYFGDKLIKSFDFSFGFCIPNSTNSWEAIYDMPPLSDEDRAAIIANPFATQSDSFYFVNNQLIMHNKAYYAYDGQ